MLGSQSSGSRIRRPSSACTFTTSHKGPKESSDRAFNTSKPLPPNPFATPNSRHNAMTESTLSSNSRSRAVRLGLDQRHASDDEMLQPRYYNEHQGGHRDSGVEVAAPVRAGMMVEHAEVSLPSIARTAPGYDRSRKAEQIQADHVDHAARELYFGERGTRERALRRLSIDENSSNSTCSHNNQDDVIHIPAEAEKLAKMYHALLRNESLSSIRSSGSSDYSDNYDDQTAMRAAPRSAQHGSDKISNQRMQQPKQDKLRNELITEDYSITRLSPLSNNLLYTPLRDEEPLLGRFASQHARTAQHNANAHSAKQSSHAVLSTVKDMLHTANAAAMHVIHTRGHSRSSGDGFGGVDWTALKGHVGAVASPDAIKRKHAKVADVGIVNDLVEMRKERAKASKRKQLKGMIRVVPNI